jgi:hypothetical protein
MNVDVIKQFSVCLKVCNFQPLPACRRLPHVAFLQDMKIKIIFSFFFRHPPFFHCKRQLPRIE